MEIPTAASDSLQHGDMSLKPLGTARRKGHGSANPTGLRALELPLGYADRACAFNNGLAVLLSCVLGSRTVCYLSSRCRCSLLLRSTFPTDSVGSHRLLVSASTYVAGGTDAPSSSRPIFPRLPVLSCQEGADLPSPVDYPYQLRVSAALSSSSVDAIRAVVNVC
jgi:hypothetical protein